MTAAQYEAYAEASSYGDAQTCHHLAVQAEADRLWRGGRPLSPSLSGSNAATPGIFEGKD